MNGDWFVAELVDDSRLKGRLRMEEHSKSGMYPFRIDIHWKKSDDKVSDEDLTAKAEEQLMYVMEKERDAFLVLMKEDKTEYLFTWYARNIQNFTMKLNHVLGFFPVLPLTIYSMDDPEWTAYNDAVKVINGF